VRFDYFAMLPPVEASLLSAGKIVACQVPPIVAAPLVN
jgi:hypothetical protein